MRRVVITGGAGFLGSHLADLLIRRGLSVEVLDNLVTGSEDNIAHLMGHPRFTFRRQDVTEYLQVEGEVDAVLHLASPASPIDYARLPIETIKAGTLGTHRALGLAMAKGARLLLASTSEVYGDPEVHPQPESYWGHVNPVGPRSMYDEAKRAAEAFVMAYRNHHGVDTRIPASSTPSGRGCERRTAGRSPTS
jgi:dTDP-glucose 4,6-dehydratase